MILVDLVTRAAVAVFPDDTIGDAARQMKDHNVGSVVVVDDLGAVVGILTDRDIVMKLADRSTLEPDQRVDEVMTRDPVCLGGNLSLERGLAAMRSHRIRRVPILNDMGELVGVISLDDILVQMGRSMGQAAGLIEEEVVGKPEDRWPKAPTVAF
jgi:CBS domain-containing protein